jgi:hypothetical protein
MKRMLFFLPVLFVGNGFAQEIRVTVKTDNGSPLPYSFVLVNDDPVGTTDSAGVFRLPTDRRRHRRVRSENYPSRHRAVLPERSRSGTRW